MFARTFSFPFSIVQRGLAHLFSSCLDCQKRLISNKNGGLACVKLDYFLPVTLSGS